MAGLGVCPLALRAIPIQASTINHLGPGQLCGYAEGNSSIAQKCGLPHASVDSLPWTLP